MENTEIGIENAEPTRAFALKLLSLFRQPAFIARDGVVTAANAAAEGAGLRAGSVLPTELRVDAAAQSAIVNLSGRQYAASLMESDDGYAVVTLENSDATEPQRALARTFSAQIRDMVSILMAASSYILPIIENLGEERAGEYAAITSRTLYRLRRLSDHAEAVAIAGDTPSPLRLSTFDLSYVVRETVETSRELLKKSENEMKLDAPQGELLFYGETREIRRMLLAMIGNAVRHGKSEGDNAPPNIVISLRREDDHAELRVVSAGANANLDTGIWARYREPELYGDRGAGLGLPLIASVARRHGGTASILTDGESTALAVRLPIRESPSNTVSGNFAEYGGTQDVLTELSDVLPAEMFAQKYLD
ncbi:MAG: hypothetical protein LBN02_06985 [Oscillospiraceae bacterium]|nr:hypothetical protein [Oscillospiraceae bacterium]